jgi:hypothetical protein
MLAFSLRVSPLKLPHSGEKPLTPPSSDSGVMLFDSPDPIPPKHRVGLYGVFDTGVQKSGMVDDWLAGCAVFDAGVRLLDGGENGKEYQTGGLDEGLEWNCR